MTTDDTQKITVLNLFRMSNGVKQSVRLHITPERFIVKEEVTAEPEVPAGTPQGLTPQQQVLASQGVKFVVEGGETKIVSVPASVQQAMLFFDASTPCWFEGCEELRQEYAAKLEEAGGADCPSCKKGDLMRQYLPKVNAKLAS